MENTNNQEQENNTRKSVVDKIVGGGRASMSDEPLTPSRKIEAEMRRMKNPTGQQESRGEEDRQVANLGGTVLTPQRKMENARAEMKAKQEGNKQQ